MDRCREAGRKGPDTERVNKEAAGCDGKGGGVAGLQLSRAKPRGHFSQGDPIKENGDG